MAEPSRGRVTITLGRTGQVAKRAGPASGGDFSDSHPVSGSKRSVRDRLGGNGDSSLLHGTQLNNKRQRGDRYTSSLNANGLNAVTLVKMTSDLNSCKRMCLTELGFKKLLFSLDLRSFKTKSPERVMGASRGLSPPRNVGEIQRRQASRTYDGVRTVSYMGKDVLDAPGPVSTTSFVTKSRLPTTSTKPMPPPGPQIPCPIPPPSSIVQNPSLTGVEQQTVEGLLHSLGLGKYAITFKAEEVDMTALKQMGENDLKELGIPMGPRKKILLALLPRPRRQP
ncbi:zinc finger protein 5-like [Hibiscus syriacus]|uniref:Zinc finger protein 5-like n=1 Tax=Hibiscus syriacus TaxID=106335 RepID=A0A6A2WT56_HIBSY|nr:zinc finger protein 5-like [Hibiscus syriacus]